MRKYRFKQLKLLFILFLFFQMFNELPAQDPPGINWKVIDTEHYKIIFPEEIKSEANRVANTVEYTYGAVSKTLGGKHKRIPLLLSNRGAIPNGYVGKAPWMSEWFNVPIPLKDMGASEWYHDLAVHETRHMVQFTYLDRGINKLLYLLFGNEGTIVSSLLVPSWYWEGDAVGMETVLTSSGRGRMPYFNREIRSLLINDIRYGYRKAMFGSYKDYYPSHYELGYLLATHVKRTYGTEVWPTILKRTMNWPFTLNPVMPFSRAMEKTTGRNAKHIYDDTMDEMTKLWKEQLKDLTFTDATIVSSDKHKVRTDYNNPGFGSDGSLYAVKKGMAETASLVRLTEDGEEVITQLPRVGVSFGLNINGGKVTWTEFHPDLRWDKLSWSNVIVYDIATGKRTQLTEKARYYNPALSADGNRVAAVEFTETRECYLVILDAETGEQLGRYESPNKGMILFPSWSPDGTEIAFTAHKFHGKGIFVLNVSSGAINTVKPESFEDILRPVFYDNYILYESPYSGIDNIYAVNRENGNLLQVTSRRNGAYNPVVSPDGNFLVFNDFIHIGNRVAKMNIDPFHWIPVGNVEEGSDKRPIGKVEDRSDNYFEPLIAQEQGKAIMDTEKIPQKQYESKDYRGISRYLNIHSWQLGFFSPPNLKMGISSSNILGTTEFKINATYNTNEKVSFLETNVSYLGWYPTFSLSAGYGARASTDTDNKETSIWHETSFKLNSEIPLINSYEGYYWEYMALSGGIGYTRISDRKNRIKGVTTVLSDSTVIPFSYELNYSKFRENSYRDILSTGRQLLVSYKHTPISGDFNGNQFYGSYTEDVKGLFKHHGVALSADIEYNSDDGYRFLSNVSTPLGYDHRFHEAILKGMIKYKFPLFYPDWDILGIAYLKRVSGSVFADWMKGWNDGKTTDYLSVGLALTFEPGGFFDLQLPFPIPISVIYAYRPDEKKGTFKFSVDF